jgi:dihydroxyacid dehydratase/phosphogluconate dehydratase
LAAVVEGDEITLDAENGILRIEVSDEEIARRLALLAKDHIIASSGGYLELYLKHVLQADEGCDFDFLVGCRGADVPAHSH